MFNIWVVYRNYTQAGFDGYGTYHKELKGLYSTREFAAEQCELLSLSKSSNEYFRVSPAIVLEPDD